MLRREHQPVRHLILYGKNFAWPDVLEMNPVIQLSSYALTIALQPRKSTENVSQSVRVAG
jgi:hypothetical protein